MIHAAISQLPLGIISKLASLFLCASVLLLRPGMHVLLERVKDDERPLKEILVAEAGLQLAFRELREHRHRIMV